ACEQVGLPVTIHVAGGDDGVEALPDAPAQPDGLGVVGPAAVAVSAVQDDFAGGLAGDQVGCAVAVPVSGGHHEVVLVPAGGCHLVAVRVPAGHRFGVGVEAAGAHAAVIDEVTVGFDDHEVVPTVAVPVARPDHVQPTSPVAVDLQ